MDEEKADQCMLGESSSENLAKEQKSWTSYQITVPLVREYLKQVATGGTTSATNSPGIYGKIVDAHDLRVEAAFLSN